MFRNYSIGQLHVPMSYEEIIPEKHLIKVVNQVVNDPNLTSLYSRCSEFLHRRQ